jgi:hypothetical protein
MVEFADERRNLVEIQNCADLQILIFRKKISMPDAEEKQKKTHAFGFPADAFRKIAPLKTKFKIVQKYFLRRYNKDQITRFCLKSAPFSIEYFRETSKPPFICDTSLYADVFTS